MNIKHHHLLSLARLARSKAEATTDRSDIEQIAGGEAFVTRLVASDFFVESLIAYLLETGRNRDAAELLEALGVQFNRCKTS